MLCWLCTGNIYYTQNIEQKNVSYWYLILCELRSTSNYLAWVHIEVINGSYVTKLQVEQNVVEPNLKVAVHPQAMRESNVLQPDFHQKICEVS